MIQLGDIAKLLLYLVVLLPLTFLMAVAPWGSAWLSVIIVWTYLMYRPRNVLHPNNMVFAFYGLYIVLSSSLNLLLYLIDWDYVLPWGQQVFWETMSLTLLFQAEFTFLVLFFGLYWFCKSPHRSQPLFRESMQVKPAWRNGLTLLSVGLVFLFMQSTAGLNAWITDYSFTYLTKREGHGLLNVIIIALGNVAVFLLGLETFRSRRKWPVVMAALLVMMVLSYIGGVKSRFIFLLIVFLSPWFMTMKLRLRTVFGLGISFFVLLYLGTLIRTEGFYASTPFFVEMLVGYFNAFQLHDWIVTSRDPGFLQTVWQIFVKPLQILGMMSPEASFDISVMLTKEFFPEQWENEHATQQWPLDTELYLNYYGVWLSWLPLTMYAALQGWLYRHAVLRGNLYFMPIFIMEFQRIFSTLRGTLIPWETPIYVAQYLLIYQLCRMAIRHNPTMNSGTLTCGLQPSTRS
ncbi:hypothetical protein [Undibacterium curvum]|uniref:hypothetical protein n=1 Tax=Undibacterium curvum TaxID=2762294 RepID=UPI003D14F182